MLKKAVVCLWAVVFCLSTTMPLGAAQEQRVSLKVIAVGVSVDDAAQWLVQCGYKEDNVLDVAPRPGKQLRYWRVGQGFLFLHASSGSQIIESLDYCLIGDGPKSTRSTFSLVVTSFCPKTGELTIATSTTPK